MQHGTLDGDAEDVVGPGDAIHDQRPAVIRVLLPNDRYVGIGGDVSAGGFANSVDDDGLALPVRGFTARILT